MCTKQQTIDNTLAGITDNIELYFKVKYFKLIPSNAFYLFFNNFCIPNPSCELPIKKFKCANMPLNLNSTDRLQFNELNAELAVYITLRDKVKNSCIDLSNRIKTDESFYELINQYICDGTKLMYVDHPFWAMYNKQKLISKMWG